MKRPFENIFFPFQVLYEVVATLVDVLLPTSLSCRLLPQIDHYGPHANTGFEGWYTRIQGDDFTLAVILCSLADEQVQGHSKGALKQHYLHFSLLPLRPGNQDDKKTSSSVPERIELHLFPPTINAFARTPGSLFTLDAAEYGSFVCGPDVQTYSLVLPTTNSSSSPAESPSTYEIRIKITNRTPLDPSDPLKAPHGSFARLQNTLPLHWGIFSTRSDAEIEIVKRGSEDASGQGALNDATDVEKWRWQGKGRAHMEKNWGVSFPEGWTWSQASSASTINSDSNPNLSPITFALAGGQILGHKASMIHFASPHRRLSFAPPHTIILSAPPSIRWFFETLSASLKREPSDLKVKSQNGKGVTGTKNDEAIGWQWGPWASEVYDNVNGSLNVVVSNWTSKLVIDVRATEPPISNSAEWLALYCPLPGGHHTSAYETFTARLHIKVFERSLTSWFSAGGWKLVEEHQVDDAALEFGGVYWRGESKGKIQS